MDGHSITMDGHSIISRGWCWCEFCMSAYMCVKKIGTGIRFTQWLKFGFTVGRRGGRGGVKIHYFLKNAHLGETWTPKKIVIYDAKCFFNSLAISKKICPKGKFLSNSPFSFPFPQSSQKREWVILRFPFPQDWKEWPSLSKTCFLSNPCP